MAKGKSTVYPSQTVFHNVCSGHTVLFLCLCDLGSKERHKAATPNCVPQGGLNDKGTNAVYPSQTYGVSIYC